MESLQNATLLTGFEIDNLSDFKLKPFLSLPNVKTPCTLPRNSRIEDISVMWPDHHELHYSNRFHDSTLQAIISHSSEAETHSFLRFVKIVSDRKTLRKIITNNCITLSSDSFYCKPSDFVIMAEKINGTLYIGNETRYEPAPGSYGRGFEELLTQTYHRGDLSKVCTSYGVVNFNLCNKLSCVVRFEVDGVNGRGELVEFKCKKKPHPRFGLNPDYYKNIWFQMILSRTSYVILGQHSGGLLTSVETISCEEVRQRAGISREQADSCFQSLTLVLQSIYDKVPEMSQRRVKFSADGKVEILNATKTLPLLSTDMRARLSREPKLDDVEEPKIRANSDSKEFQKSDIPIPEKTISAIPTGDESVPISIPAKSETTDESVNSLLSVFNTIFKI